MRAIGRALPEADDWCMTTLLAVLTLWTLLSAATAAGFCLVFAGARRSEERALLARTAGIPAQPRALVPVSLPTPRASAEHAVRV